MESRTGRPGSIEKYRLKVNLQLFAEDKDSKTEKATPKKRQDARKRGQVFQSREIISALLLLFVFLCLKLVGNNIYKEIAVYTEKIMLDQTSMIDSMFTIDGVSLLFTNILLVTVKMAGPIVLVALITGLVGSYAQVGFLFTLNAISMKLSRINPIEGFKRLFSFRSVIELIKALIKIIIIIYMVYESFKNEFYNIMKLMYLNIENSAGYIVNICISTALKICLMLIVFGIIDYLYQWWEYERGLRMTKQELKEEYKQVEGNPETKSRIKQKQRQISLRRMMHEVPTADVVITNPTHYAVALKYDAKINDAPVVIAKGQDYIALKIKEIAKNSGVEIVENKELARTLFNTVDIGQAIPPELYQAVAEILAFIYNLKGIVNT